MEYEKEHMIDLNEENVRYLFRSCIATDQTPAEDVVSVNFVASSIQTPIPAVQLSQTAVKNHYQKIRYITGQLESVHVGNSVFHVNDGFKKYDGSFWTQNKMAVFSLYYLSSAANVLPYFRPSPKLKTFVSNTREIEPTFSPNDPNFDAWQDARLKAQQHINDLVENFDHAATVEEQIKYYNSLSREDQEILDAKVYERAFGSVGAKLAMEYNRKMEALNEMDI